MKAAPPASGRNCCYNGGGAVDVFLSSTRTHIGIVRHKNMLNFLFFVCVFLFFLKPPPVKWMS